MGVRNRETGLTEKQEAFCFQVVRMGDASKAYRIAYDAGAMQPRSVYAAVSELMAMQKIADRIDRFRRIADAKLEVSIERIAKETARLAFYDPGELYDEMGKLVPLHQLPEDLRRAIAGVDVKVITVAKAADGDPVAHGELKKYRMAAKIDALRLLAQWKKMIGDKPGDADEDVSDPRRMTMEQIEAEIRANNAALAVMERHTKRAKAAGDTKKA